MKLKAYVKQEAVTNQYVVCVADADGERVVSMDEATAQYNGFLYENERSARTVEISAAIDRFRSSSALEKSAEIEKEMGSYCPLLLSEFGLYTRKKTKPTTQHIRGYAHAMLKAVCGITAPLHCAEILGVDTEQEYDRILRGFNRKMREDIEKRRNDFLVENDEVTGHRLLHLYIMLTAFSDALSYLNKMVEKINKNRALFPSVSDDMLAKMKEIDLLRDCSRFVNYIGFV